MTQIKWVYNFNDGNTTMRNLLGGKGANLAEMTNLGLPIPNGFTITTEACVYYMENQAYPNGLTDQIHDELKKVEVKMGQVLGDTANPLLLSVRSGARVSMPGMMDTVLNLGLNDETVKGLSILTGNKRFALDSYRRLIQMFGTVVFSIDSEHFENVLTEKRKEEEIKFDNDMSVEGLEDVVFKFKEVFKENAKIDFPQDPKSQLDYSIKAVFDSWNAPRAIVYREIENISDQWGTAVNVQCMAFGNMGDDCATGVTFSRSPVTGEKAIYGDFLINAQGEDVVAGIRQTQPIAELKKIMPEIYNEFVEISEKLEKYFKEIQDIEFTVQTGKLYILQTRNGKRTGAAAVKTAYDMVKEGLIDKKTAILRITPRDIENILFPRISWHTPQKSVESDSKIIAVEVIGKGLAASPGAATGKVIFDPDKTVELAAEGESIILVRHETTPEDVHGMHASRGVITATGGLTSHAAVVARQMGRPCIVDTDSQSLMRVNIKNKTIRSGDIVIKEGDFITMDGFTGIIYKDELPTEKLSELPSELSKILDWADTFAKLKVRANADSPIDNKRAFEYGAIGVGLCRTEHMFFDEGRLPIMQKMILADNKEERISFLNILFEFQEEDFYNIFKSAEGKPITIRLIDPPLHEFLPKEIDLVKEMYEIRLEAKDELNDDQKKELQAKERLLVRVQEINEVNPMLGIRGCRLAILFPEIVEMQSKAIFTAASRCKNKGIDVHPEVMVPLVGFDNEFLEIRKVIDRVAEEVFSETETEVDYLVGTMIEVPRAALTAGDIASGEKGAEFFSFGTNDLHQMTLAFSRDDAGKFISHYLETKIMDSDPFETIDQVGTGKLMKLAVKEGREEKPDIKIGICGEQGGDPASIEFCHKIGLDYVSCSPFRIPIARLAVAQVTIKEK
jgi:pyruvate,orthophosphate dikinase